MEMRKLGLLGTLGTSTLIALNGNAAEVKLNVGYDLNRKFINSSTHSGFTQPNGFPDIYDYRIKNGMTFGVEYLFDNQGEAELGVGIEHKPTLVNKDINAKIARLTPVYLTGRYNIINKDGKDLLYAIGRVGYVHTKEHKNYEESVYGSKSTLKGGPYWAIGMGTEVGPVSVEAIYERSNVKYQAYGPVNVRGGKEKIDTFGVRVGYRLGNKDNYKFEPSYNTGGEKTGEIRINAGYDFKRKYKVASDHLGILRTRPLISDYGMKNGPVLGVEWLFDNQGQAELGIGIEHKLSNKSFSLKDKQNNKMLKMTPIYLTGKYNVINKDGNDLLYGVARVGYTHAQRGRDNQAGITGGLYTAIGIGTEYKSVSAELLYERTDFRSAVDRPKLDTVGIRIGYRFGNTKNIRNNRYASTNKNDFNSLKKSDENNENISSFKIESSNINEVETSQVETKNIEQEKNIVLETKDYNKEFSVQKVEDNNKDFSVSRADNKNNNEEIEIKIENREQDFHSMNTNDEKVQINSESIQNNDQNSNIIEVKENKNNDNNKVIYF